MKIMVTGGAGFIGSHVAEIYLRAGHEVWIVDDLSTGKPANIPSDAYFVHTDIAAAAVRRLLVDEHIEVINHHAAQMDVRRSVADPLFDARVNILGLLNILEGARQAQCRRIIFASSGGTVYGEQEIFPATEDHTARPISPYGVSKLAGERYLYFYHREHGIPSLSLRYANVYGPRQDPHGEAGVVAIFTQRLLAGETITINGDGQQTRDYVFVDDVAQANLAALTADYTGALNIGTSLETTVNTLAEHLQRITGSGDRVQYGAAKPGEQRRSVLSWNRAADRLNWKPLVSLADGLEKTVASLRTAYE